MPDLGIIILAAGGSTRMGQPKQLLQIGDQSLMGRVAEMALALGADPVIVVLGNQAERVGQELNQLAIHRVINPDWQQGMASSLRKGIECLDQFSSLPKKVMILVCDQVLIDIQDLKNLEEAFQGSTKLAIAAEYHAIKGVPAIFNLETLRSFGKEEGDFGARYLLKRLDRAGQLAAFPLPSASVDLDTPEDYERFLKG